MGGGSNWIMLVYIQTFSSISATCTPNIGLY